MDELKPATPVTPPVDDEDSKFGSRKLWIAIIPLLFILCGSTVLFSMGKLSEPVLVDLWKFSAVLVGTYVFGNVATHLIDAITALKK